MTQEENEKVSPGDMLHMTVDVVAAYVGNNPVVSGDIPTIINTIHSTLSSLARGAAVSPSGGALKPAVPVRRSITPDYIICLEDGKKLKMLKRHLRAVYNMSPEDYRAKWSLPATYPMVAPNYAAQRSAFAKKIGLGRKPGTKISKSKSAK